MNPVQQQTQPVAFNPMVAKKIEKVEQPMTQEEEFIFNSFENYINLYNTSNTDENKQKDFSNKLASLFLKLKSHDLKLILIKLLVEFINGNYILILVFDGNGIASDLKKIYTKIQANNWDQNKSWMSCIEKIILLRK
jgi:hypothetical protein